MSSQQRVPNIQIFDLDPLFVVQIVIRQHNPEINALSQIKNNPSNFAAIFFTVKAILNSIWNKILKLL